MKKSTILVLTTILCVQIVFQSCNKAETNGCQTTMNFEAKCTTFDFNNLEVLEKSSAYYITNNDNFRIDFEHEREAVKAIEIIKEYEFNEYCTIGIDTSFSYFLTNGQIPQGEFSSEDCLSHSVCELNVELTPSGNYTLVQGDRWIYGSESEDEAFKILNTIQHFQSNFGCYVGRPITKMSYLRK